MSSGTVDCDILQGYDILVVSRKIYENYGLASISRIEYQIHFNNQID